MPVSLSEEQTMPQKELQILLNAGSSPNLTPKFGSQGDSSIRGCMPGASQR